MPIFCEDGVLNELSSTADVSLQRQEGSKELGARWRQVQDSKCGIDFSLLTAASSRAEDSVACEIRMLLE